MDLYGPSSSGSVPSLNSRLSRPASPGSCRTPAQEDSLLRSLVDSEELHRVQSIISVSQTVANASSFPSASATLESPKSATGVSITSLSTSVDPSRPLSTIAAVSHQNSPAILALQYYCKKIVLDSLHEKRHPWTMPIARESLGMPGALGQGERTFIHEASHGRMAQKIRDELTQWLRGDIVNHYGRKETQALHSVVSRLISGQYLGEWRGGPRNTLALTATARRRRQSVKAHAVELLELVTAWLEVRETHHASPDPVSALGSNEAEILRDTGKAWTALMKLLDGLRPPPVRPLPGTAA
ncbi:hypothetical protein QFC20_004340 [Naganishia adeliensis]|uniref:Uncharacterized protein n=1 Tax=Naganishia adeliensis TaxID=92952 RepID=A0ACC2W0F8_9TREE|nr:hypothetical protein QFC20_004340 [Naganishia adeliensis]